MSRQMDTARDSKLIADWRRAESILVRWKSKVDAR